MRCCISQNSITSRIKNNSYTNDDLVMSDNIDEDDISFDTACEMGLDQKYFPEPKERDHLHEKEDKVWFTLK